MSNHSWAPMAHPHLRSPFPLGAGSDGRQASAPGLREDGSGGIMSSGPGPRVRLPGSTPFLLQFDTKQKQTHRLGNRLMVTKRERRLLSLFSCSVVSDSLSPMGCSTPGFPILHQHLELAQTHVHQLSDAIHPFHPLSSPSLPAFNLSHHQVTPNLIAPKAIL